VEERLVQWQSGRYMKAVYGRVEVHWKSEMWHLWWKDCETHRRYDWRSTESGIRGHDREQLQRT